MVNKEWRDICRRGIFLLFLFLSIIFISSGAFAASEDGADEDSPRALSLEENIAKKREKSPAILLKEKVESQIPKPTLPEGKTLINQINVIGSTLLAEEAIDQIKKDFENKELTGKQMQRIADLITRAYSREGYITSYGYIIPDKIYSGILDVMVVEGRTGQIEIVGNKYFSTDLLTKKITLKEGQFFNFRQLNLDVYRINKNPDMKASIACDTNIKKGLTDVTITVKDKSPMHVVFQVDNYGSEYILYQRFKTFFTHNNITGHDDSVTIKLQKAQAEAHELYDIDYFLPLNEKWKLELYYMPFKDEDYYYDDNELTDFETHARKFYFWFNQSLIDEPECQFVSQYGFKYMDIHWYSGGQNAANSNYGWHYATKRDRFRVLMWGLDLNRSDKYGRWVISNDLEKGIPGLWGASPAETDNTSVAGAGSGFTKNHLVVARRQKLFAGIDFIAKGHWQLSSQSVTGVNVFSVGGIMGVIDNRGYPRAQAPGDTGESISAGFSFPPFGIPRDLKVPSSKTNLYDAIKLFTFFDWGRAHLKNPPVGQDKTTSLSSVGCGITFAVPDKSLSMRLDVGWPISADMPKDQSDKHPRVLWSITQGF